MWQGERDHWAVAGQFTAKSDYNGWMSIGSALINHPWLWTLMMKGFAGAANSTKKNGTFIALDAPMAEAFNVEALFDGDEEAGAATS